jgi:hypothetical protein
MEAAENIPTIATIDHPSSLVTTISDPALATKDRTLKIAMIIPATDPSSNLVLLVTTISDPAMAKGRTTPLTLRNVRTFATPDPLSNLALLATRAPYRQKLMKLTLSAERERELEEEKVQPSAPLTLSALMTSLWE